MKGLYVKTARIHGRGVGVIATSKVVVLLFGSDVTLRTCFTFSSAGSLPATMSTISPAFTNEANPGTVIWDKANVSGKLEANVPSKPMGGDEEYTFSPDGKLLVFSARIAGREEAWSTNFALYEAAADGTTVVGRDPESLRTVLGAGS